MERISCIIRNGDSERVFHKRGVADLLWVLDNEPELLRGADVNDRVVGKGAAALLIVGGARRVVTPVVSRQALAMLERHGVEVKHGGIAVNIMSRDGQSLCPLERRCQHSDDPAELLPTIRQFVEEMSRVDLGAKEPE